MSGLKPGPISKADAKVKMQAFVVRKVRVV
jgi:hypothetical protein